MNTLPFKAEAAMHAQRDSRTLCALLIEDAIKLEGAGRHTTRASYSGEKDGRRQYESHCEGVGDKSA
jgi:hypothetical protein